MEWRRWTMSSGWTWTACANVPRVARIKKLHGPIRCRVPGAVRDRQQALLHLDRRRLPGGRQHGPLRHRAARRLPAHLRLRLGSRRRKTLLPLGGRNDLPRPRHHARRPAHETGSVTRAFSRIWTWCSTTTAWTRRKIRIGVDIVEVPDHPRAARERLQHHRWPGRDAVCAGHQERRRDHVPEARRGHRRRGLSQDRPNHCTGREGERSASRRLATRCTGSARSGSTTSR